MSVAVPETPSIVPKVPRGILRIGPWLQSFRLVVDVCDATEKRPQCQINYNLFSESTKDFETSPFYSIIKRIVPVFVYYKAIYSYICILYLCLNDVIK